MNRAQFYTSVSHYEDWRRHHKPWWANYGVVAVVYLAAGFVLGHWVCVP